jgi:hypothetical protein
MGYKGMKQKLFNSLLAFILLAGIVLGFALPVYATIAPLTVAGEGHYTIGTYAPGVGTFAYLNTPDGDAQYLLFPNGFAGESEFHTYHMSNFATPNDHIDSVTLYVQARSVSADVILRPVCRIDSTDYIGSDWNFTTMNYELESYTWTLNPDTGVAWTTADINGAEFGFNRPAMNESHVTYMRVDVDCEATGLPTVDTDDAEDIAKTSATMNGEVTEDGGQNVLERGFVWSLTSNSTTPGNIVPPATYTWEETEGLGNYGENPFDSTTLVIPPLAPRTTYYYRACAENAMGWAYGEQKSFMTLGDPSITTVAATYIEATTARLNALLNDDGGQACDVRFGYATGSMNCTFAMYTHLTSWVNNTYFTGQTPYVDITGLTSNTTYFFCVEVRNVVSTQSGGTEPYFTTEVGIDEPSTLKGVPTATAVSLTWEKGDGATNTLIRGKTGGYPTGTADGTSVYFDDETSYKHTGLDPGTTWYYMAWGESGGAYSAGNTTLMVTTLAGRSTEGMFGSMSTPSWWFNAPDYTKMNNFPFYPFVNWVSDCFDIPRSTFWFVLAMFVSIFIGVVSYMGATKAGAESFKPTLALMAEVGCMAVGTSMGLIPGWLVFMFLIFAVVSLVVGMRT